MRNLSILLLFFTMNGYSQIIPLQSFKKSSTKIENTHFEIYKGIIKVKINHDNPASGYLSLPVHIIKSSSKTPAEPIYWMEGGPGFSNFRSTPPKVLLANHDFVLVGYRGADGSVMKKSKKLIRAMRGVNHQLLSNKSLDNLGKALKQYSVELANDGIDINHFTIIDVIDDFEEVRKLLGHQKIILYSGSYGTRVALLYSYRYPDAIKRSLMVGVNPPGYCMWYPENTNLIIHTYDSIYTAQSGSVDISIEESIRKSFERMPQRWSFFKLDAGKIKAATFFLLFDKKNAVMVFDAYRRAALKDDYSGLYLMQLACDYVPGLNYGDLFSKAVSADFNAEIDYRQLFRINDLEIGAPASLLYWGVSNNWPIKLIDEEYRKPRRSNTETLLISGNLDITNPPLVAKEKLLPYLQNGKQVILKDMAHCGDLMYLQYDAYTHMVLRFIDDGIVDTSKFKHDPVCFKTKKSFNKIAKMYYPVVLILSLLK